MCRVLCYLGKSLVANELLYKPDNSFIKQSYHPRYMSHLLNLAGFGLVAWDKYSHDPSIPFIYKTPHLPFYDENLHHFANKITPYCMLAHVRGVPYDETRIISFQNVHPFIYEGTNMALAHNGALAQFDKIKYDLLPYIKVVYQKQISGTTDSEWIYALVLSQLSKLPIESDANDVMHAVITSFEILQKVRRKYEIQITSPINLFISNGDFIVATRFVLDFGWYDLGKVYAHSAYHSLWYTYGESYGCYDNEYKMKNSNLKTSIIVSSEPLTEDTTTWIEVPEYSIIAATHKENEITIVSKDITL